MIKWFNENGEQQIVDEEVNRITDEIVEKYRGFVKEFRFLYNLTRVNHRLQICSIGEICPICGFSFLLNNLLKLCSLFYRNYRFHFNKAKIIETVKALTIVVKNIAWDASSLLLSYSTARINTFTATGVAHAVISTEPVILSKLNT